MEGVGGKSRCAGWLVGSLCTEVFCLVGFASRLGSAVSEVGEDGGVRTPLRTVDRGRSSKPIFKVRILNYARLINLKETSSGDFYNKKK